MQNTRQLLKCVLKLSQNLYIYYKGCQFLIFKKLSSMRAKFIIILLENKYSYPAQLVSSVDIPLSCGSRTAKGPRGAACLEKSNKPPSCPTSCRSQQLDSARLFSFLVLRQHRVCVRHSVSLVFGLKYLCAY